MYQLKGSQTIERPSSRAETPSFATEREGSITPRFPSLLVNSLFPTVFLGFVGTFQVIMSITLLFVGISATKPLL